MNYSDAFRALGYSLISPRQEWSAEGDKGVCISLWMKEIHRGSQNWVFDTWEHADTYELWSKKVGNSRRILHLSKLQEGSRLDVVLVHGTPGEGFGDAEPWNPEQRRGRIWRLTKFDPETGHFRVETELENHDHRN